VSTEPTPTVEVMELLRLHVPLSLLMDLADPEGPRSHELLDDERYRVARTA